MALKGYGDGLKHSINDFNLLIVVDGSVLSKGYVSKWMRDLVDTPQRGIVAAAAKILGVSPGWLTYGEGPMKSGSGEHPAVIATFDTGAEKPNLAAALRALNKRSRWTRATINAALSLPVDFSSVEAAENWLDRVDAAIRPLLPPPASVKLLIDSSSDE